MNTRGTDNARSPGMKLPLTGQKDCQQAVLHNFGVGISVRARACTRARVCVNFVSTLNTVKRLDGAPVHAGICHDVCRPHGTAILYVEASPAGTGCHRPLLEAPYWQVILQHKWTRYFRSGRHQPVQGARRWQALQREGMHHCSRERHRALREAWRRQAVPPLC
jgi:hypothetical protein